MKKLIFLILILLTGCGTVKESGSTVTTPELNRSPINGKWVVTKTVFKETGREDSFKYKDLIGSDVVFSNTGVLIANTLAESPGYKIRKLNAADYIEYQYNFPIENLGFRDDYIDIIDVYESDEYLFQVLKQQRDNIVIHYNGIFIMATRVSDSVTDDELNELVKKSRALSSIDSFEEINSSKNAVILGLRNNVEGENNQFEYSSLLIDFSDDEIRHFFMEDILVPRQSNFIHVNVQREDIDSKPSDKILISYRDSAHKDNPIIKYSNVEPGILNSINFISPDYINIEMRDSETGGSRLALKFIDNLEAYGSLGLGDIVENGERIFKESSKSISDRLEITALDDRNIGIFRDNGFWKFKGRVDVDGKSNNYKEFDISILIPKEIVKYDDLSISSSELKNKFPQMNDCFISPNNKFLIVVENSKMVIYNIVGGRAEEDPVYEIELEKNYSIIMSEWAVGRYTDLWEREFKGEQ